MRVAGIPARIVTGYQGGEFNTVGKFLEVRQANAHAWAEVWLEGRGWVRIDPTTAIAPGRVEQTLNVARQIETGAVGLRIPEAALSATGWLDFRQIMNSMDYHWQRWVVSYGAATSLKYCQSSASTVCSRACSGSLRQLAW